MKTPDSTRWLRLGRMVLFVYAAILISISLAGITLFPAYAGVHAAEFTPNNSWTSAQTQAGLAQLGWPATLPAFAELGRSLLMLIAGGGVSLLLLWRRPSSWFILYLAFVLVSFGAGGVFFKPLFSVLPGLQIYTNFMAATSWQFFFILFFFFPDGRPVPAWTRWVAFFWLGLIILSGYLPISLFETPLISTFLYVVVISALGSQFFRFFWRSNPVQRQQTKWIVAVLILMLVAGLATSTWLVNSPQGLDLRAELIFALLKRALDIIIFALVPITIAVSIFHYRLWDIDLVIRRTLAYGAITAVLALVYLGAVTLFQQIFTALTGQNSPAAVVLSTLLIAVLVTPLRRHIQDAIDQRFYRQKYNAEQAVAAFAASARSEVSLDALGNNLVVAARKSLQPERISLWLKKVERNK